MYVTDCTYAKCADQWFRLLRVEAGRVYLLNPTGTTQFYVAFSTITDWM